MTCSEVIRRKLCNRAILPDGNLIARAAFLRTSTPNVQVDDVLAGMSSHGLSGEKINRARVEEMELFQDFFRSNRSPTGRTRDSHGRYYGAVYTLSAKIVALRSKEVIALMRKKAGDSANVVPSSHAKEDETLSGIFNRALQEILEGSGKRSFLSALRPFVRSCAPYFLRARQSIPLSIPTGRTRVQSAIRPRATKLLSRRR